MADSILSVLARLIEANYNLQQTVEARNDAPLTKAAERIDGLVTELSCKASELGDAETKQRLLNAATIEAADNG